MPIFDSTVAGVGHSIRDGLRDIARASVGLNEIAQALLSLANSVEKVGEGYIDEMAQRRMLDERIHEELMEERRNEVITVNPPGIYKREPREPGIRSS